MLCPICRTGTMSETRPYVWSCSLCGHTEFRPNESSSYASSYDTSSSYGAQDFSYSGSGSRSRSNSKKLNALDIVFILISIIICLLCEPLKMIVCVKRRIKTAAN